MSAPIPLGIFLIVIIFSLFGGAAIVATILSSRLSRHEVDDNPQG